MSEALSPNLKVIGRYTILREMRRDRHSVSYAAVDPVMNRELVVKAVELLAPGASISDTERERIEQAFSRQAQAAGRLHHPHILTVFDAGLSHDFGYLVIERLAGQPLHDLLARGLRPAFAQCASIVARIADAIDYAHGQGLAHGQLGPQFVYLRPDGAPKITGFGGWIDAGLTGYEALAQTEDRLPYFQNEANAQTLASDVRAIGALLHMMLTGRAPRRAAPGAPATEAGYAPVRSLRADVPANLARLVDSAQAVPPPLPVATAGALRDALTTFIWNERAANVAPATLGIPLGAPPSEVVSMTFSADPLPPSGDSVAAPAPARPATETLDRNAAAGTALSSGTAAAGALDRSAGSSAAGIARAAAAFSRDRAAAHALSIGTRLGAIVDQVLAAVKPVLERHQFVLTVGVAIVVLALGIGTLLGALGHGPQPRPPGPTVVSDDARALATAAPAAAGVAGIAAASGGSAIESAGRLEFNISPWGEILVDGRPTGVAPPLSQITLSAGRHTVEIRHGENPAWIGQINIDPAHPLIIEHHFE